MTKKEALKIIIFNLVLFLIIFLFLLLLFFSPKISKEGGTALDNIYCDCLGFSKKPYTLDTPAYDIPFGSGRSTICYGMPYNCRSYQGEVSIFEYLKFINPIF